MLSYSSRAGKIHVFSMLLHFIFSDIEEVIKREPKGANILIHNQAAFIKQL